MYIVGGNHDYYDSVMGYGGSVDKSVVYDRKTLEYRNGYKNADSEYLKFCGIPYIKKLLGMIPKKYSYPMTYVLFCGKVFAFHDRVSYEDGIPIYTVMHDSESIIKYYDLQKKKKETAKSFYMTRYNFNVTGLHAFYDEIGKLDSSDLIDIHHKYQCPIILFNHNKVIFNPILKEIEFYKIVDPFSAYQELSMFLSGVLTTKKKLTKISDDDRFIKHGFDNWSFRKKVR